jgi:hypothetical protein
MKTLLNITILTMLISCSGIVPQNAQLLARGDTRFEMLGMLNEYMGRNIEGDYIESFFPDERSTADHFEGLLRKCVVEEGLEQRWIRNTGLQGHVSFTGTEVARFINAHYRTKVSSFVSINPKVLRTASTDQKLQYIAGAYRRYGDDNGLRRAIFGEPNAYHKMTLLADVLRSVGCSNVTLYSNAGSDYIPTSYILVFSPTYEIRKRTGIRRELSDKELNILIRQAKLQPIKTERVL